MKTRRRRRSPLEGCTKRVPAVRKLFLEWKKEFLADCEKERPHGRVSFGDEEENLTLVEDQIAFIEEYLCITLLSGSTPDHIRRIEWFLSMQEAHNPGDLIEIRFIGGAPVEVYVFVVDLHDIDVADIYGITEFDFMDCYLPEGRTWKGKLLKSFLKDLWDDLTFDYGKDGVALSHKADGNMLHIECGIDS